MTAEGGVVTGIDQMWGGVRCALALVVVLVGCPAAAADPDGGDPTRADPATRDASGLFRAVSVDGDRVVVRWNPSTADAVRAAGGSFTVEGFPLPAGRVADLRLEPFVVPNRGTRFVIGRKNGPDEALDFDPTALTFLRGEIVGRPGSHVFLALGERISVGYLSPGAGERSLAISSRDRAGSSLGERLFSVTETTPAPALPPDVPMCAVEEADAPLDVHSPAVPTGTAPGTKHLEVAVETDYEFFQLFGDVEATAAYLSALFAAMSDIYLRDVDTWVDLVFARIWDDPDDLFNVVEPTPLFDFKEHWNLYMTDVNRDAAQLLSGRRDYPFGGQAFLATLCSENAYSVVGYASGVLTDPGRPSPLQYDLSVAAHELGHNAGAGHTQDSGIDSCHNPLTTPQRGTIMSYCGQTWSGGNSNRDPYFHSIIQESIDGHVNDVSCVVQDCNLNGIPDNFDVQILSDDDNDNGVPDECEDCNDNGVLDDADIAAMTSTDLNLNGIPDECEPDCDGNQVPDDKQIADGTSFDQYGNDIPDECETDCDGNAISDYAQIQADMSFDVDRNAALDSCQDCDGDGTTDHDALGGAHNLWAASGLADSPIREFFASTGVLTQVSSGGQVNAGHDLIYVPEGRLLVTSSADHRVMEFDLDGVYQGDLVPPGAGGLMLPAGLVQAPDGSLLVASRGSDRILAYDSDSGGILGAFVPAASGGLVGPFGMTFGPDGDLYVTSATDEVLVYDGQDGTYLRTFVPATDNGGLSQPRGLVFKPDGNLLVASFGSNEILEYDGSGAPLGKWAKVGTQSVLTQVSPWGIRIGPNGNVFAVRTGEDYGSLAIGLDHHHGHADDDIVDRLHLSNAQIYEYDVRSGDFVRTHVGGNDHGLLFPTGFDFVPGWEVDCNLNLLPDTCDVESGASQDGDSNGVPDECETDCNANGTLDRLDVVPYGPLPDCNTNLVPDECDVASGTSDDCDGDGLPDECETDCNANLVPDDCEIAQGLVTDCNANGVPDLCDVTFDFEEIQGWSPSSPGDDANKGIWIQVNPHGTAAQTEYDHTAGDGRFCFVTGQGSIGGEADEADVDGGKTTLTSPSLDLTADPDPQIGYWRWFSNDTGDNPGEDVLEVDVSSDGGQAWTSVEVVGPTGEQASGGWFFHAFRVADFVAPSADVKVRFVASDEGGNSTVEAAIDDVVVVAQCCETAVACDDGLACTVESCNAAAGQCGHELAPGTCLIDGACWADGQLNPLDECEICDSAAPSAWSSAAPVEVQSLVLDRSGVTRLEWAGQGAGADYDVAGDFLSTLLADGSVAAASCLANSLDVTFWEDTRPDPPAGDAHYYLVRSRKLCGSGPYGWSSAGDERIPAGACP